MVSRWTVAASPSPSPRGDVVMAYDSTRAKTVLFGGSSTFVAPGYADTWEWDGALWSMVSSLGPEARSGAVMAYDSGRRRMVLFGGVTYDRDRNAVLFGDTWEWDGIVWTRRATTGPPPRNGSAMVYDSGRQRILLFGGYGATHYGDTWEWDGAAWTKVSDTGPSPRLWSVMAYDRVRQRAVLFGGQDLFFQNQADTWEWNGSAWTEIIATGPSARAAASMTYDPDRNVSVLFGGASESNNNDTWEWDGNIWRQTGTTGPSPRNGSGLSYDASRKRLVIFGGFGLAAALSDTWERNGTVWAQTNKPLVMPEARMESSFAFDAVRGKAVLFGGRRRDISSDTYFTSTWVWNGTAWDLASTTGPVPRVGAPMVFDSKNGQVLLFGGGDYRTDKFFNDTWSWNGSFWSQKATTGPQPRYGAVMAFDTVRRKAVLFGGYNESINPIFYGDTWEWNGAQWTQVATVGPSPRMGAAMAFDEIRGKVVLFGGLSDNGTGDLLQGDTWQWDGTAWSPVASSGPSPRSGASMVFDAQKGRVILFGGTFFNSEAQTFNGDTWEWNGTAWSLRAIGGPADRGAASMVYDSIRRETLLFGGGYPDGTGGIGTLRDLWRLNAVPGPFTTQDVRAVLGWIGGLANLPADQLPLYDVVPNNSIDLSDATRIARKVAGLEANP